mgnify:CR=1 FL=1
MQEKPSGLPASPRRYLYGALLAVALCALGITAAGGLYRSAAALAVVKKGPLAAAGGLTVFLWLLEAWRLKAILALTGDELPLKKIIPVNLAFSFAAAVTPAAGGGPPALAYLLYRQGIPGEKALAAAGARTIFAVGTISLLNLVIIAAFRNYPGLPPAAEKLVLAGVGLVSGGILVLLHLSLHPGLILALAARLPPPISARAAEGVRGFSTFFRALIFSPRKNMLFLVLSLSFLYWGVFFSIGWLLARSLGSSAGWAGLVARQLILHFLLAYVPLPGASGVAEMGYAAIFAGFVPEGALVAQVAGWRFFTYYLNILAGGFFFWWLVIRERKQPPAAGRR